jgi:hypothetical protein
VELPLVLLLLLLLPLLLCSQQGMLRQQQQQTMQLSWLLPQLPHPLLHPLPHATQLLQPALQH